MPASAAEILPRSSTALASVNTSPAPPTARLPKCTRCHACGCPSFAEYSHIGETTIRFFNSISRIRNGLKSFILVSRRVSRKISYPFSSTRSATRAKQRGPHAYFRRPFFNRHFKIVRHPHRQHRQRNAKPRGQIVTQLPQPSKMWPRLFRILHKRRNAHQSRQLQRRQRSDA